ncbi:MAG: hypothetical protein HYV32_05350 [Candidatus Kerfeldbacteria bacterium]|nr:hypothetical protein [Candidatus Kerfeldbacteria bacterium]
MHNLIFAKVTPYHNWTKMQKCDLMNFIMIKERFPLPPRTEEIERAKRTAAKHDARIEAEVGATDIEREQQRVRPATTIAELQATTTGAYSPFHELETAFPYEDYPRVNLRLFETQRLCERYIGTPADTDVQQQRLIKQLFITHDTSQHARQRAGAETVYRHVVTELQRKLHELHSAIEEETPEGHPLRDRATLLARLSYGEISEKKDVLVLQQRVESFIGAVQQFGKKYDFPAIEITDSPAQTRLVIPHPFTRNMQSYWQQEQKLHKEKNLQASILRVTENAIATLTLATEDFRAFEQKHHEEPETVREMQHIIAAYNRIIEWLRTQHTIIARLTDTEDLSAYMQSVNFFDEYSQQYTQMVDGGGEDPAISDIGLLPALDVLKTIDAPVYAAFSGIAAGEDVFNPEATLSEYIGLPFGMAMLNTPKRLAEMRVNYARRNQVLPLGFERVEEFVGNLNDVHVSQPEFFTLNATQLKTLELRLAEAAGMKPGEKPNADGLVRFASFLGFSKMLPAYALHETLQRIEREDREMIIGRLRVAGATEFMRRFRMLPEFMTQDPQVVHIIEERIWNTVGFALEESTHSQGTPVKYTAITFPSSQSNLRVQNITHIEDLITLLRDSNPRNRLVEENDMQASLWQTAEDAAILSKDFLENMSDFNKAQLLSILNAHPHISKEQWVQWFNEHQKKPLAYNDVLHAMQTWVRGQSAQEILRTVVRTLKFTQEDVAQTQSQFFILLNEGEYINGLSFPYDKKLKWLIKAKTHPTSRFIENCLSSQWHNDASITDLDAFDADISYLPDSLENDVRTELIRYLERGVQDIYTMVENHIGVERLPYGNIDLILHAAQRYIPENPVYKKLRAIPPEQQFYVYDSGGKTYKNNIHYCIYDRRQLTIDTPAYFHTTHRLELPSARSSVHEALATPLDQWQPDQWGNVETGSQRKTSKESTEN